MEMDSSAIQLQPNPVEQFVRLKLGVQAKPLVGLGEGDLENSAHVRAKIKCGAPLLLVFHNPEVFGCSVTEFFDKMIVALFGGSDAISC